MSQTKIREVDTVRYQGQNPGTSGLRKKTREFMQPHYLENFIQSIFDALREKDEVDFTQSTLVVGGDGRYHNRVAVQVILKMAAANGLARVLVGCGGLLSTPAMSAVIRRRKVLGGILLTASHNPGGRDADFGVKFNPANGGPAAAELTDAIYSRTLEINSYRIMEAPNVDIDRQGMTRLGTMEVEVIDPVADYVAVMEELFDFDRLHDYFKSGFRLAFDAMHGVTGIYAREIFEKRLASPVPCVLRGDSLEDFGGMHPDPNQVHAADLVGSMAASDAPDLGAACDGDGDRNMILGPGFFVTPGDSLAVIAENLAAFPGYRNGLVGVARSMPTSRSVDRVAKALQIPCYETPTGWKYFVNLMEAGRCTLCGEESFGTGSDHVREKDGLWAVLCWMSILEKQRRSLPSIVREHWRHYGRSYFQRHDYEELEQNAAEEVMATLRNQLPEMPGRALAAGIVTDADEFNYTDPIDGSVATAQGLRVMFQDGSRLVSRLSGTGTQGATLRIYLERFRNDAGESMDEVMKPMQAAVDECLPVRILCRRDHPDVIT